MALASPGRDASLVTTKLVAPPAPPGVVDRGRLLTDVLKAGGAAAVTVIAPAGSGKTVLLAQAAQRLASQPDAVQVAWLSLDEKDDDPRAFWAYVRASVTGALRPDAAAGAGATPAETAAAGAAAPWAAVAEGSAAAELDPAGALIGLLADAATPVALLLDDFHAITDERIHRAVGRLIGLAPPNVTVVLSARSSPPLPLTRWRLAGRLVELTGADLAFTAADAARLLRDNLNVALRDDQVTALVERTQGWAAGLRVAGLSLQRAADRGRFIATFSGDHHDLVSYLGSEVLDRLPEHLRGFLVRTAVLRRLTPAACDAVLDLTGSAADLEQLARAGLFVTALDESWSAYAVHPLFRDVLLGRLRTREPGTEPTLHRRAADWFAGQGEIGEAVEHLLALGDTSRVRQLLVEHQIPLSNRGRHGNVWHWLGRLPPAELETDPGLCLMAAWTRLNDRDYPGAEVWLRRSGKHPDDHPARPGTPGGQADTRPGTPGGLTPARAPRTATGPPAPTRPRPRPP